MLFGKRRRIAPVQQTGRSAVSVPPEMYVVAYERMLKGNKLSRRGRPIRQVAVVVHGTVKLITSGDAVDRKTYEALILSGAIAADEGIPLPGKLATAEAVEDDPETL